jgi:hypothetical protein
MWEVKNIIRLKSQIYLQLSKTWMIMWISIKLAKVAERIPLLQSKSKLLQDKAA